MVIFGGGWLGKSRHSGSSSMRCPTSGCVKTGSPGAYSAVDPRQIAAGAKDRFKRAGRHVREAVDKEKGV
jgi:hypothetical protein